ncbi:MAG TPA: dihydroorotase [Chitinophagaceae bacterium]|nr:dihydroorotase [Chitinophagaceae bacterium]
MQKYLFRNIQVVNEGKISRTDVLVSGERIERIDPNITVKSQCTEIDGERLHLFPGVIDDQVHFREPGLTHKGNIFTESRAAVAGGVTSFMEMPNTIPNALNIELLEDKYRIASGSSFTNYSFFMGVSNSNADEALKVNKHKEDICGIKIFMGSSTGNMLVDNHATLNRMFSESEVLIATHCEDERIVKRNYETLRAQKQNLEPSDHPIIRDDEACFESSLTAIQFAKKYNSRLHILHISTEKELVLFGNMLPLEQKRITSEVCVHHLHFTSEDYANLGYRIKCNPAIKAPHNKEALWKALLDDRLDIIATDHAPHLLSEKEPPYEHAHAGLPLVQHAFSLMLYYHKQGYISLEKIAEKMSHAVATCFQVRERGFIREGYYADLAVVDLNKPYTVKPENTLYKCGWSPLQGMVFPSSVTHTMINGQIIYENGEVRASHCGQRLRFNRP